MPEHEFIDFYELLQISPNAEAETIQRVYKLLAARYHPDNPQTGDMEMFLLLNRAFSVLSNPDARSAYDVAFHSRRVEPMSIFNLKEFAVGIDGESNRRMGILCLLYNRRRSNPEDPGLSLLEFETMMSFPREHLMFTIWYLRERGQIRLDEESDFVITGDGVDYVEGHLPKNQIIYRLLKAAETGASHTQDGGWTPPEE